jgi:hypothetical protein
VPGAASRRHHANTARIASERPTSRPNRSPGEQVDADRLVGQLEARPIPPELDLRAPQQVRRDHGDPADARAVRRAEVVDQCVAGAEFDLAVTPRDDATTEREIGSPCRLSSNTSIFLEYFFA